VTRVAAHGFAVEAPPGWEVRIFRRPAAGEVAASPADGPPAPRGETTHPVVHCSTVPMPTDIGDFGSSGVDRLGPDDVFVVVFDYGPGSVGQPLFATKGMPRTLEPSDFDPNMLQRTVLGQAGYQAFFTEAGRACCLYVVLGSYANRRRVTPQVNALLAGLTIAPPEGAGVTVPVPPATVLGALEADPDHTRFTRLIVTSGLAARCAGPGPLSVFAPTDAALARIPDFPAIEGDRSRAGRMVQAHLVAAEVDLAALTPAAARPVTPLDGSVAALTTDGTTLRYAGIPVDPVRIVAGNGSVYPIDGVREVAP
jgi:uncharacterized surface protein with fasciclin (FAS1) repeats